MQILHSRFFLFCTYLLSREKKFSIELIREDVADNLRKIILALKDGAKSPSELEGLTKIKRITLWRNCQRLANLDLIRKEGGKFGKYRLTVNNYVAKKATRFANTVLNQFVGKGLILDNNFCIDYLYHKDIMNEIKKSFPLLPTVKSEHEDESEPESEDIEDLIIQLQIYEFSRAMGAYITYVLIHAVSEYLWRPRTNFELDIESNGKEKNKSTEEWIKNTINSNMLNKILHATLFNPDWIKNTIVPMQILDKFSKLEVVKRGQKKGSLVPIPKLYDLPKNKNYYKNRIIVELLAKEQNNLLKTTRYPLNFDLTREDHKKEDDKVSGYEMVDKTFHDQLMNAYKSIFPDYYHKLEDIRKEVDDNFSD